MSQNEISGAKTFSQAFETLRKSFFILLAISCLTVICSLMVVVYVFRIADHKVYIVAPGSVMLAVSDYDHQTTIYEIRNHVKAFCSTMFAWDKDDFNTNVEQALNLVNHSDGLKIFNTFKENEVFENLVSTSAKVSVKIDSVDIDMDHLPYTGKFYLSQTWRTPAGEQTQGIGAWFQIIPVSRSEKNPYGLSIQKINFFQYQLGKLKENSFRSGNESVLRQADSIKAK